MTMGISTYGVTSMLTSILQNNSTQMTNLTEELSTGDVSQSLTGYGEQASQILGLNASIDAANAYANSTTTVSTYLNGYTDSLTDLISDATQLSQGLSNLANGTNSTATSTDSTSTASFAALVSGLEVDTSAQLNTQVGNRYIFAGSRYDTAPAVSISSLPAVTSPTAFTATTSPALPSYDSQAASLPGGSTAAYATQTVTIADDETVNYGITSTNPAIQQLVYALQNASAATNASDPNQSQYITLAENAANAALSGLQALQAQNSEVLSQVTTEQTAQQQSVTTLSNTLGTIETANSTQVASEITAMQTQIEASYKATSALLSLSLASYLSTSGTS
jgi:flagellar hook-associated protein 3 FlgL